ncbi:hypothetical protein OEZ86_005961 [Tetradesmus obliquus]|nr:hypothetical protein OEZ86_005961 [Tetradesmus obliquus]
MTTHAPTWAVRHSSVKLVPSHSYSSSPGDRSARPGEIKAYCQAPDTLRQQPPAASRLQLCNSRRFPNGRLAARTARALPEQASPAAAATEADPEAIRLMTAATILSASQSDSDADAASVTTPLDSLEEDASSSLAMLDEMTVLNADSLALVVGILRQQQPLEADDAGVQLSERLRDLLLLLRQRPASPVAAAGAAHAAAGSAAADADVDGFWAGPDEWADVRSALMSIGINASVDEDDDEDVWAMEEEGPARRTRLLRSLPRLDADTSAALAAFLAEQQQRDAANRADRSASRPAASQQQSQQKDGAVTVIDDEQEERWWDEVTQAYQQLWQQARLQQAKQTELGESA